MPDPTFTLEHEESTWRVTLTQGGKDYTISLTRYGTGTLQVRPLVNRGNAFRFHQSATNTLLALGRLFVAAARKAGADDA